MHKNMMIGIVVAASMAVAACGPQPQYQDPMQDAGQVAQQGGSIIEEHPYLTAGAAAAGAYYLGKRSERRNGYNGYRYNGRPRTRYVERTIVRRAPSYGSYRSYSRPAYRTVTRTVRYRK